ncbi:SGNH/GDSL hydrolase family protein [Aminipila sp.]|uniref:SGNH/GDSL hydrolase family protein n=1 Tax=Aminipila sp. TaxID=2060095 RepID=UPI003FA4D458
MVELAKAQEINPVLLTPLPIDPGMAETRWMVCDDVDYEAVQDQIIELRKLINKYGEENKIKVIDTFYAFSEYVALVGEQTAYYDGIHPTRAGHQFLAEIMRKFL